MTWNNDDSQQNYMSQIKVTALERNTAMLFGQVSAIRDEVNTLWALVDVLLERVSALENKQNLSD